jgi:uncharacterized membrane protein YgdD (TMEM256/DUF423 family)
MTYKPALIAGSIFAMLSVIIGAFGAHYLKTIFSPETLISFETGVRYQFYHGVALLFIGIYAKENPPYLKFIFACLVGGILLFSGSIYLLCILKSTMSIGLGGLGILTPLGGLLFIAAWAMLIVSIVKTRD